MIDRRQKANRLVYELYELTEAEIVAVEEGATDDNG
jgi:hypothetical protein